MDAAFSRRMWQLVEPVHAVVYFEPQARAIYTEAGLKGGWMGYFASRAAAMGPVPAEVVVATFFNFHPSMVRRAIPDAWRFSTPATVLEARLHVADVALRRLLGEGITSEGVRAAAALARRAAGSLDAAGRPLFAAHASLPWPEQPHLQLWHAATLLREFRGDGHVALLTAHRIDGCEANVLITADEVMPVAMQQEYRGWSLDEWAAAEWRLRDRGLLDKEGLAEGGRRLREEIEHATDLLALPPYTPLGEDGSRELAEHLVEIDSAIVAGSGVPFPNPMGLTPFTDL
ncbi:MAG: SCO6745 family protein [Actinomycetota bacterium]